MWYISEFKLTLQNMLLLQPHYKVKLTVHNLNMMTICKMCLHVNSSVVSRTAHCPSNQRMEYFTGENTCAIDKGLEW